MEVGGLKVLKVHLADEARPTAFARQDRLTQRYLELDYSTEPVVVVVVGQTYCCILMLHYSALSALTEGHKDLMSPDRPLI